MTATTAVPDVLVIQPDPLTGLDRFEDWLGAAGVRCRTVHPYAGELLPDRLETDGLIVLGGLMSVAGADRSPWVAGARSLMRQALLEERPLLGICLGAQLLAQTAGGAVTVGDRGTEAGAVRVRLTPDADRDALFAGAPDPFVSGSFHSDVVTGLPPDAVLLGGSATYPHQAFRVGRRAWGVQFHPELTVPRYRSWVRAFGAATAPAPELAAQLRDGESDLVRAEPDLILTGTLLARRFAGLCSARSVSAAAGDA